MPGKTKNEKKQKKQEKKQKKKEVDLKGLNKLHMKKQGLFKKEVVPIFQWIKYSQWLG